MKFFLFTISILFSSCSLWPGSLTKLEKAGVPYPKRHAVISLPGAREKTFSFQYLGCGGIYLMKDDEGILIDPFFSNQSLWRVGRSLLIGKNGSALIASDPKMVDAGWQAMQEASGKLQPNIKAIFSAHSHYDHLLDIPALVSKFQQPPVVYLNQSGYYNCANVMDTAKMVVLEKHMTTLEIARKPIEIASANGGRIQVHPILSEHNPHFKNIKFFDGERTRPMESFNHPYSRTRANDWLEGHTFSFLIDYLDASGNTELRLFIQSSACNPPYGIPERLVKDRPVDIAFIGIASYQFSPDYPCTLLEIIKPRDVVWIHWEDFFRKYTKTPKTVRGTNVPKFFDLSCLHAYRATANLLWPRVKVNVTY